MNYSEAIHALQAGEVFITDRRLAILVHSNEKQVRQWRYHHRMECKGVVFVDRVTIRHRYRISRLTWLAKVPQTTWEPPRVSGLAAQIGTSRRTIERLLEHAPHLRRQLRLIDA